MLKPTIGNSDSEVLGSQSFSARNLFVTKKTTLFCTGI